MSANKYVIGLTGGIATGKSHVSGHLKEKGIPIIDADQISHRLTRPGEKGLELIRLHFGEEFILNGELDRKALGALIFADPKQREKLNAIMHPLILEEIDRCIDRLPKGVLAVLDAPLLFETGLESRCIETWAIVAGQENQISRLMQRDGFTEAEAIQRIDSQMPREERMKMADFIIDSSGTKQETKQQVNILLENLKRRLHLD